MLGVSLQAALCSNDHRTLNQKFSPEDIIDSREKPVNYLKQGIATESTRNPFQESVDVSENFSTSYVASDQSYNKNTSNNSGSRSFVTRIAEDITADATINYLALKNNGKDYINKNLDFRESSENNSPQFSNNLRNFYDIILQANLTDPQKKIVNDLLNNPRVLKKFLSLSDVFPSDGRSKRSPEPYSKVSSYLRSHSDSNISQYKSTGETALPRSTDILQPSVNIHDESHEKNTQHITSIHAFHIENPRSVANSQRIGDQFYWSSHKSSDSNSPNSAFQSDDIQSKIAREEDLLLKDAPPLPVSQPYKTDGEKHSKTAIDHFFDRYQQFLQTSIALPEVSDHCSLRSHVFYVKTDFTLVKKILHNIKNSTP